MVTDEQLRAFCDAVRAKDDWENKILDKERGLGPKWALEAQLLSSDALTGESQPSEDEQKVLDYLWELEQEARRIIFHDHTLRLTTRPPSSHQTYDFEKLKQQAIESYKFIKASKYGTRHAELKEEVGVFVSDDLVPTSLHAALVAELDRLADTEPKDFHPGSRGKVQDIIHPSLYPYWLNCTPLSNGTSQHPTLKERIFHSAMHTENDSLDYMSSFAWLPSIFRVSEDGASVEIQSYINGLGSRECYPELFNIIEQVFTVVMPLLEKTVGFEYDHQDSPSECRWRERYELGDDDGYDDRILRSDWEDCLKRQAKQKEDELKAREYERSRLEEEAALERTQFEEFANLDMSDSRLKSSFAGKDLKVIVKAANYVLKPGASYEGTWHIEGMPHERIVASAIYYYESDPSIIDKGLSLRRARDEFNDFPQTEFYSHEHFSYKLVDTMDDDADDEDVEYNYPSDWEEGVYTTGLPRVIALGTVPTTNLVTSTESSAKTGRLLTFPNWIQHKVTGLENGATEGGAAQRKILCFFLVNDEDGYTSSLGDTILTYHGFSYHLQPSKVLTTSDVPPQARGCNFRTLHVLLPIVCRHLTGKMMPAEIVELIINADDDHRFPDRGTALGMSRKVAEATRRAVMDDRRIKAGRWESLYPYSLCEH